MKKSPLDLLDFRELTPNELKTTNGGIIATTMLLAGVCTAVVLGITTVACFMEKH